MLRQNRKETPIEDTIEQNSDSILLSINNDQLTLNDLNENEQSRKIGKWTPEEDELLRKYVPQFGEKQWRKISEFIPGRTSIQCLHRWTKILKPGLVKGPWTAEEDQKLITWVKTEGPTKWAQCANFINGRSGKQCRERWFNNLNPNVKKGNWTKEEDGLIFDLYQKYGSSLSKIAKFISGRTENAIKNRFYSTLRKLAADKRKGKEDGVDDKMNLEEIPEKIDIESLDNEGISPQEQAPNLLYRLLHDKTTPLPEKEEGKIETSLKNMNEQCSETKLKANEKTKSSIATGGDKLRISREKIIDKKLQDLTKFINIEFEENDLAFEEFLVSIDNNVSEDFLTKEFESNITLDDLSQLESLQTKILGFCQNNIKELAESFKSIAKPRTSSSVSEGSPISAKTKHVAPSTIQPPLMGGSNVQQSISNVQKTTILTPTPANQKDFSIKTQAGNKSGNLFLSPSKGPSANAFSLYNPSNNASGIIVQNRILLKDDSENSSDKAQITQKLKHQEMNSETQLGKENTMEKSSPEQTVTTFPLSVSQFGSTINFNDMIQKSPADLEETEKRMTFLFQQLFSLETLLAKTKNSLVQFESSFNKGERKNSNQENLKIEEIQNEATLGKMKALPKQQRSLEKSNSEFEQILKKKKIE